MLALSEVAGYLLVRGLIDVEAVVDGRLTIQDVSSRNQNCAVSARESEGFFIKQAVPTPQSSEASATGGPSLAHEAAVYELIGALPRGAAGEGIRALLPRCYAYDQERRLLLLGLLDGAQDLTSHHSRAGRFSTSLARRLGAGLGDLHQLAYQPALGHPEHFRGRVPWVLGLDCPGTALLQEASQAGLQLVQILQSSWEMRAVLAELRTQWRVDAFVHHDLKWDNCLVLRSGESRRCTRIALVDWEFADLGDACWDAGSVLGNYLSFWLASVPVTGTEPPDRYLELARYPLSSMQPAMNSFWAAYTRGRGWDASTAEQALLRCVRYAGARLVQSAYERTLRMSRLDGNSVCLLQLALNVMTRPREAAHHLLGIAADGALR